MMYMNCLDFIRIPFPMNFIGEGNVIALQRAVNFKYFYLHQRPAALTRTIQV